VVVRTIVIQSSEWAIGSLDYDHAMRGPRGSGQRYFPDQMLILNENSAFVVWRLEQSNSYSFYRSLFTPRTVKSLADLPNRTAVQMGGNDRGFVWGKGHTLIRYPSVPLTNFTVQKLSHNLQTREYERTRGFAPPSEQQTPANIYFRDLFGSPSFQLTLTSLVV
jgi:hypothetical protein